MVKRVNFRQMAVEAARAAFDKKAEQIMILDIGKYSDVADFMVVATADSTPQLQAVSHHIISELKAAGLPPLHADGNSKDHRWVAIDYGGLLVHVMLPEARAFYRLESLWEKPRLIAWDERLAQKRKGTQRK